MENVINITYNLIILVMVVSLICILVSYEIDKRKKRPKKDIAVDSMKKVPNIEELREKFKYDLIGKWASCEGTFKNIMDEVWIFYPDGKGETISESLMSGKDKELFLWRKKDFYCIEILYTDVDEPSNWLETRYDFCELQTEYGVENALVQLDNKGKCKKGFGLMNVPLKYNEKI